MPRRPTQRARRAALALRKMAARKSGDALPLPTSRELGKRWGLNHSTVFRLLVELSQEGVIWQHPNGRFYPAAARERASHGLPVVFIGRQIKQWSHLYQEILEGVSEVCVSSRCPLLLLSSDCLVEHDKPETPPRFAAPTVQNREIARLLTMVPKPCSGAIFDHLWSDGALRLALPKLPSHMLLLRPSELAATKTVLPDYAAGAMVALRHMVECGYEEAQFVIPFSDDPSTEQFSQALAGHFAMAGGRMRWREPWDCATPRKRAALARNLRQSRRRVAVLVPEDNIAMLLLKEFGAQGVDFPRTVGIISLQGTAGPTSPLTRVRYDYRRLGRMAAGALIGARQKEQHFSPALIAGRTTMIEALI